MILNQIYPDSYSNWVKSKSFTVYAYLFISCLPFHELPTFSLMALRSAPASMSSLTAMLLPEVTAQCRHVFCWYLSVLLTAPPNVISNLTGSYLKEKMGQSLFACWIIMLLLSSADFLQNQLYQKILQESNSVQFYHIQSNEIQENID